MVDRDRGEWDGRTARLSLNITVAVHFVVSAPEPSSTENASGQCISSGHSPGEGHG